MPIYRLDFDEKINEVLSFLGFHRNERLIYLDLLQHGPSTALDISKRTKIHRPNTYDTLRELTERGFIVQTRDIAKTKFKALDPVRLQDYVEQKKREIHEIIPLLQSLSTRAVDTEEIAVSEGVFAARSALLSLIDYDKDIKVFGASQAAVEAFGIGFLQDFHKKRVKKKIQMYHIYSEESIDRIKLLNKIPYTEARSLSKDFDSHVATVICHNAVILFIFSKTLTIISIRKKDVADAYSGYYEILWNKAKKV